MIRETVRSSSQEQDRPAAVSAPADVERPGRSEQPSAGNEDDVMPNAPAGWPPPRRPLQRADRSKRRGPDPRPVQRPNFTAIVNASRSAVHVHGELNVLTVDLLRGAIAHLRAFGHDHITVDLAGLVCVNASAMREVSRLQHALRTEGAVVIFVDTPAGLAAAGAERRDQVTTIRPLATVSDNIHALIRPR